jgi:ribosomal protein S18 acetylase RimI-like enzyme
MEKISAKLESLQLHDSKKISRGNGKRPKLMTPVRIEVSSEDNRALEDFLEERLYEFNVEATGFADGKPLFASVAGESGATVAGLAGHTWGGCCEITKIWVHRSERSRGIGTELIRAAEREARRRGCEKIVLSTHSFQAPKFYEKLGFSRLCSIPGYPKGYEDIIYTKTFE